MPRAAALSSSSIVAGVPRSTRISCFTRPSPSMARKWKPPDGWPQRTRLLTCRETPSTSGPSMPRRGCPSTAPRPGCARSTGTNPGITNCAPKRWITAARRCTPTLRTTRGCGTETGGREQKTRTAGGPCHGRADRSVEVGLRRALYARKDGIRTQSAVSRSCSGACVRAIGGVRLQGLPPESHSRRDVSGPCRRAPHPRG